MKTTTQIISVIAQLVNVEETFGDCVVLSKQMIRGILESYQSLKSHFLCRASESEIVYQITNIAMHGICRAWQCMV